jgi:hypothetical protein
MSTHTTNLLRRTLVSLGAALALAAGTQVFAQGTVTLTGTSGNSCNYNQMTVTPNGNIQVNCGTTTSPGIATFALTHPSGSTGLLPPNTSSSAIVARTGGPSEAIMVTFSVSGTGCSPNSGGILLNAGQSSTIAFSVGAAGTNCIVTIGATGHTTSPNQITFVAQSGTTPPPPPPTQPGAPNDCPAILGTSVAGDTKINDFQTVDQRRGSPGSGAILYYPVPPSNTASVKVTFDQGQTGWSPAGTTEYQVSPCPGVWDPAGHSIAPQCKMTSTQPNNVFTIWTAPATSTQGTNVQGQGDLQYLCYAPVGQRTYYVNVRWTYACPPEIVGGYGGCGYSMKWRSNNSNGLYD